MSHGTHHLGIGLDAALSSEFNVVRVFARLSATAAGDELAKWFNAELKRPDVEIGDLFFAIAQFGVQIHAGFAAQTFTAEAVPGLIRAFHEVVTNEYPKVIDAWRQREAAIQ